MRRLKGKKKEEMILKRANVDSKLKETSSAFDSTCRRAYNCYVLHLNVCCRHREQVFCVFGEQRREMPR